MNYTAEQKIERIKACMRRYFDCNDAGVDNPEYDEDYEAQSFVDDVHDIIGEF